MDWDVLKILIWALSVVVWVLTGALQKIIEAHADWIKRKINAKYDDEIKKITGDLSTSNEINEKLMNAVKNENPDTFNKMSDYIEIVENKDNLSKNNNMVIVAVWASNDWNIANRTYYCEKWKEFQPWTEYIWFYAHWIITWYGKKIKMNEQEIKELPLSETPIANRIKDHDFYKLDGFESLKITWYDSSNPTETPILSRRYVILDELLKKR